MVFHRCSLQIFKLALELFMQQFIALHQALIVRVIVFEITRRSWIGEQDKLYTLSCSIRQFQDCWSGCQVQASSWARAWHLGIHWSSHIKKRAHDREEM